MLAPQQVAVPSDVVSMPKRVALTCRRPSDIPRIVEVFGVTA
jgi:hypothetical protein